ncbi:hypothetical protein DICPUDRAFT_47751 [Dictyostelium purpureum]|uniref:E1 ubiquitin-activating enzyme n=1 Tax=Dictyostelium purpureum TaxID=5786 RepID=F0ZL08_DICPU|nr:uncharacterized protein DICPUDRAFT_47751 [Dictyostelium purpureum]EGC35357.1 hypothetical protein DICPUDRAFT_47751 [Dictyostelium purpureum]|eukprot:XP_003288095.1 hypothetical protein DICPUDRAFT_47751 [Dictyostelium purpureum]
MMDIEIEEVEENILSFRDNNLDDSLYSRQRYVLGDFAMSKLSKGDIFISGIGGLGVEIAKNLILAGIKSITLHDCKLVSKYDLSSQFYLSHNQIGKENRAVASHTNLQELNPYVKVNTFTESSLSELIKTNKNYFLQFKCIILTESNLNDQILINEICRENNIYFLMADCHGLISWCFNDFGESFKVFDKNGEETKEIFISNISKSTESPEKTVVTCMEGHHHGFEDNDMVEFKEIIGLDQINNTKHKIQVVNSNSFSINLNISNYSPYQRGGIVAQIKTTNKLNFKSLKESIVNPDIIDFDFLKDPKKLHIIRQSLELFKEKHNGELPKEYDQNDFEEFLEQTLELLNNNYFNYSISPMEFDKEYIKKISYSCRGKICSTTAALGGFVAQEALKSLTGKFTPLKQWLYFENLDLFPSFNDEQLNKELLSNFYTAANSTLKSNRQYAQLICLGEKICKKLESSKLFMVGSGAIGCEMLKNFALLSVACNKDSNALITVTDNDLIEKSNLNRQFLFRNKDINQSKSLVASRVTEHMNPSIQIKAHQDKIDPNTEHIYNSTFYESLDCVVSALDNVEARLYLDKQCITNKLAFLESGTLGTKGHVQVILPYLTETYASQKDPNEKQTPFCTLKSFPTNLDHCIQWSRDKFEKFFTINPNELEKFIKEENYLENLLNSDSSNKISTSKSLFKMMNNLPYTFQDCITYSRIKFEKLFNHSTQQLLKNYPLDLVTKEGVPFWSSPKRPPTPLKFDENDSLHLSFIKNLSLLLAEIYNVSIPSDISEESIVKFIKNVTASIPEFKSKSKVIISDEKAAAPVENFTLEQFKELQINLTNKLKEFKEKNSNFGIKPLQFEKDDDSNHHINFITSISNLRARIYQITECDRFKVKLIAGKIIPAIATTTSVISGFLSLELIKTLSSDFKEKFANKELDQNAILSQFRNYFVNLSIPSFQLSEPAPPPKIKITNDTFTTLWESWDINNPDILTIGDFNSYIEKKYNLKVSGIYQDVSIVYMSALPSHRKRLTLPIKSLLNLEENQKFVELYVSYLDGENEAKGPPVRLYVQY